MQSGMQAAMDALEKVTARRKHVILLTDGWSRSGDLTALVSQNARRGHHREHRRRRRRVGRKLEGPG